MSTPSGTRVALLEARMSQELASLIRRHGGEPVSVPAVREQVMACAELVDGFLTRLEQGALHTVIFLTGVGVNTLVREAERLGRRATLLTGLARVTTICRGPKPVAALKQQGGITTFQVPAPYTTTELLTILANLPLAGQHVGLVHYGERNIALTEALQERGAQLDELCLYEWLLPDDLGPLQQVVRELIAGQFDAIAFTSQVQIRHLWQVATAMQCAESLRQALTTSCLVAAVGPTCAAALTAIGITPPIVPAHPKMGPMVTALMTALRARPCASAGEEPPRAVAPALPPSEPTR